tara:strand:- start:123 stop:437 length:315 start_codon:yes stop_codon:yes gene_type:complete
MKRANKRTFLSSKNYAIFLICSLCIMILLVNEFGLIKLLDLKKQKQSLEQEIASLDKQESKLRTTIYQLQHDQEYIEKIARERYMMALPGEKVYRIVREKKLNP